MQHSTLTEQARHWAASQPEQEWMRDLAESGAKEYTWGSAVAEIDRVAAWLEAEFGHGERMALLSIRFLTYYYVNKTQLYALY